MVWNKKERKISRMEWKTIFYSPIPILLWISLMAFDIRVAKGGGGGLIAMLPMIKMSRKRLLFL